MFCCADIQSPAYVFLMAGKTEGTLLLSSSIQYIINVVMTVPALIYMDRWGRRPTLLVGAALMAIWMFCNAGILSIHVSHLIQLFSFPLSQPLAPSTISTHTILRHQRPQLISVSPHTGLPLSLSLHPQPPPLALSSNTKNPTHD